MTDKANMTNITFVRLFLSLSAITILAKFFGFAEKIVIAHYFGASTSSDIYFAVTGIVFSVFFLIKELIYPSLLPVYTQTLAVSSHTAACFFSRFFSRLAGLLLILTCGILLTAPMATRLFVPGFSPAQQQTAAFVLRSLLPCLVFLSLSTVTYVALNAKNRFALAALGDLIFKGVVLVGFIILLPHYHFNVVGPILSFGALLTLLFHLYFLDDKNRLFSLNRENDSIYLKKSLRLMAPLILGVVFSHISDLFDTLLASRLPSGQISYLTYSKKIVDAALLVGPVAIVTIAYPRVSLFASQHQHDQLQSTLAQTVRFLLLVSLPIATLLIFQRIPLLQCLFQHGRFTSTASFYTANALLVHSLGFVIMAFESLVIYCFFALSDTVTPVLWGVTFVIINILLAFILIHPFQYLGIALALVLAKSAKIILLGFLLYQKKKLRIFPDLRFFSLVIMACVVLALIVVGCVASAVAIPVFRAQKAKAEWRAPEVGLPASFEGAKGAKAAGDESAASLIGGAGLMKDQTTLTYNTKAGPVFVTVGKTVQAMQDQDISSVRQGMSDAAEEQGFTVEEMPAPRGAQRMYCIDGQAAAMGCVAVGRGAVMTVITKAPRDAAETARTLWPQSIRH